MANDWRVTHQTEEEDFNPATTNFTPVVHVHYEITAGPATGVTGSVKIPVAQYNAATVSEAISARVAAHHDVKSA